MISAPLDNLVRIGQLKAEPPAQAEFDGLVRSGRLRLKDARIAGLSLESRFDLAYNAAHALSSATLPSTKAISMWTMRWSKRSSARRWWWPNA